VLIGVGAGSCLATSHSFFAARYVAVRIDPSGAVELTTCPSVGFVGKGKDIVLIGQMVGEGGYFLPGSACFWTVGAGSNAARRASRSSMRFNAADNAASAFMSSNPWL